MRDEGAGGVASAGYMRAGIEVRVGVQVRVGAGGAKAALIGWAGVARAGASLSV